MTSTPWGIVTSLCPCVPSAVPHPDDVTILFLDYDVIIFDDVNPLGYCDVTVSLCPSAEPVFSYYCTPWAPISK